MYKRGVLNLAFTSICTSERISRFVWDCQMASQI